MCPEIGEVVGWMLKEGNCGQNPHCDEFSEFSKKFREPFLSHFKRDFSHLGSNTWNWRGFLWNLSEDGTMFAAYPETRFFINMSKWKKIQLFLSINWKLRFKITSYLFNHQLSHI